MAAMTVQPEQAPAVRSAPVWPQRTLLLLPAVVFYGLLLRFLTAVPMIDDFWQMFAYAGNWHDASSTSAHVGLLLHTQVGPYKLILEEAVIDAQLLLTGKLHLRFMILLGNLTILGVCALLWKNTPAGLSPRDRWLRLLPVSLLLFSLNYAETLDWAGPGLQEPAVVLFSLASIHCLVHSAHRKGGLVWACGFGLLASATFANGMLVWPVGILFLMLQFRQSGWSVFRLLVWSACFVASLCVYLNRYQGSGISARVSLWKQAVFLLSFCGGGLENMHHRPVPYLSVAVGLGIAVVIAHAAWTRYDRSNPFFSFTAVWLLLTAAAAANGRVALGLQTSLSSRYKLYCDLLLIFCYVYGLDRWTRKGQAQRSAAAQTYVRCCVAAALLFCVGSDVAGGQLLSTRKHRAENAMRAYLAAPESASPMFLVEDVLSPDEVRAEDLARQQLNEAVREGLYTPPAADRLGLF